MTSENIPISSIKDLSKTTYLVYNYMKNWSISNFEEFKNTDNNTFSNLDKKILKEFSDKYPNSEIVDFISNRKGLECAVLKNPTNKSFSIVFRGSESFCDWVYDLLIFKYRLYDNIKVHYGFYRQLTYQNTLKQLYNIIEKNSKKHNDYSWFVSGHSLGGALSILGAYLFSKKFSDIHFTIVSLASPRVGNVDFAYDFNNQLNLTHYRICNNKDIVTAVPYFGYRHTGYTIHYKNNKWIKIGNNYDDHNSYNLFKLYNCFDHLCSKYIINIEKLI
jgi:predicted lipase